MNFQATAMPPCDFIVNLLAAVPDGKCYIIAQYQIVGIKKWSHCTLFDGGYQKVTSVYSICLWVSESSHLYSIWWWVLESDLIVQCLMVGIRQWPLCIILSHGGCQKVTLLSTIRWWAWKLTNLYSISWWVSESDIIANIVHTLMLLN